MKIFPITLAVLLIIIATNITQSYPQSHKRSVRAVIEDPQSEEGDAETPFGEAKVNDPGYYSFSRSNWSTLYCSLLKDY